MKRPWVKNFFIVEQRPVGLDAPSANQQGDRLSYGDSAPPQRKGNSGCANGNQIACHGYNLEPPQQSLDFSRLWLAIQALQHLANDQVPDNDLGPAEYSIQPPDMGRIPAIEEVDQDCAVDNDHPIPRPL